MSEIKPVDYGQGVFGFHLRVNNLGASFAHSISLNVQTDFQRPVIHEFIKAASSNAQAIEFSVLTAGEIVSWEIRQAFTDDEIRDIKLGKRRFYVYGTVAYRDVSNKEHTNRFNYLLSLTPPITFLAREYTEQSESYIQK